MEEAALRRKWKKNSHKEELYWKQKSKAQCLKEGDKNTTFFHRSSIIHRRKNHISSLMDDNNRVVNDVDSLSRLTTNYFATLFREDGDLGAPTPLGGR